MTMQQTKVGVIQMNSCADPAVNCARATQLIQQSVQQGAQLIVLPENFACIGIAAAQQRDIAESSSKGPLQQFLSTQARTHGVCLSGGTIPILSGEHDRIVSTSILYSAQGQELARYEKIHLFDVDLPEQNVVYKESAIFSPGKQVCVVDSPLGRLGIAVCYDVRFPEQFRLMSKQGVDIFVLPAAFTQHTGAAHWHTLLKARAIENQAYMVAAAQTGTHADQRQTYGHSMVVNGWGNIIAELAQEEGVLTVPIDLIQQNRLRQNFPCLAHRRL